MKQRKAFTLVELLVVISIIALLLSILMPALNKVRSSARVTVCQSNIRQLGMGLIFYCESNSNKLIPYTEPSIGYYWMDAISPYLSAKLEKGEDKSLKVAFCPEAQKLPDCTTVQAYGGSHMSWQMNYGKWKSSYGNNGWWFSDLDTAAPGHFGRRGRYIYRNMLQMPFNTPLFADALWITGWPTENSVPPEVPAEQSYSGMETFCIDRHETAINVALADGSARKFKIGELWLLLWHRGWEPKEYHVRW